MTGLEFALMSLAVWRVTHLFTSEDGPFDVFARLRAVARTGPWSGLLNCFYCLSLWAALPCVFLLRLSWPYRFICWLALSAAAILINRLAERFAPATAFYFEDPEPHKETP